MLPLHWLFISKLWLNPWPLLPIFQSDRDIDELHAPAASTLWSTETRTMQNTNPGADRVTVQTKSGPSVEFFQCFLTFFLDAGPRLQRLSAALVKSDIGAVRFLETASVPVIKVKTKNRISIDITIPSKVTRPRAKHTGY